MEENITLPFLRQYVGIGLHPNTAIAANDLPRCSTARDLYDCARWRAGLGPRSVLEFGKVSRSSPDINGRSCGTL